MFGAFEVEQWMDAYIKISYLVCREWSEVKLLNRFLASTGHLNIDKRVGDRQLLNNELGEKVKKKKKVLLLFSDKHREDEVK